MIYNEKITLEREDSALSEQPDKIYVDVTAVFSREGSLTPSEMVWTDGRRYAVDRVLRVQREASRKAGGTGICYTCMIRGNRVRLFYEENFRWFVTRKS
ncbi:MAG: hypothetical protein UHN88_08650 [Eubacterium sp.]|nr:hypothetical protein [Eubacterium sp.]